MLGSATEPCALQCVAVEDRAQLPPEWFERYAFGIVRRGVVVRERVSGPTGERTAVDAAGPGAYLPLRSGRTRDASGGYAASRVLLCLYPRPTFEPAAHGSEAASDLLGLQGDAIERLERIADARGRASGPEKVAAMLEVLGETVTQRDGSPRLLSNLQQRDLAALLQLRPETVSRALRRIEAGEPEAGDGEG